MQISLLQFIWKHCGVSDERKTNNTTCVCVYRPPPSARNKLTTDDFLDVFGKFLSGEDIPPENVLVVGDFNFQMAESNDPDTRRFVLLNSQLGLEQFVTQPLHVKGHILDIVLSRARQLVKSVTGENLYSSWVCGTPGRLLTKLLM